MRCGRSLGLATDETGNMAPTAVTVGDYPVDGGVTSALLVLSVGTAWHACMYGTDTTRCTIVPSTPRHCETDGRALIVSICTAGRGLTHDVGHGEVHILDSGTRECSIS